MKYPGSCTGQCSVQGFFQGDVIEATVRQAENQTSDHAVEDDANAAHVPVAEGQCPPR